MKYCKNCGASLEDDSIFCSKCGSNTNSVELSKNEQQDSEPLKEESISFTLPTDVKKAISYDALVVPPKEKKKKGKGIAAAIAAAVIVVIAAGAIVFAKSSSLQNSMKLAFMDPDKYLREIAEESINKFADQGGELYDIIMAPINNVASTIEKTDIAYQMKADFSLNPELASALYDSMKITGLTATSFGADISANLKDNKIDADVSVNVNGSSLGTFKYKADSDLNKMFLQIPELSSTYLEFALDEFESQTSFTPYFEYTGLLKDILGSGMFSKEELQSLIKNYSSLMLDLIKDVDAEKDVKITSAGVTSELNKFTVSITEKQLCDVTTALLMKAKEDEVLLGFADHLAQTVTKYKNYAYDPEDGSISMVKRIDRMLADLSDSAPDETLKVAEFNVYINNAGEIKGLELDSGESSEEFISYGYTTSESGSKSGTNFWLKRNNTVLCSVDITSTEKNDKYSGSLTFTANPYNDYYGDYTSVNLVVDFADVSNNKEQYSGTYTVSTDVLPGSSISLKFAGTDSKTSASLDVTYMGMFLGTLSFDYEVKNPEEVTMPGPSDSTIKVSPDGTGMTEYTDQVDVEGFINSIGQKLGLDLSDLVDEVY